ncbi:transcription initiation factor TFIID subunit 5 isoform X2 [Pygocentrus nattereri]|uniref:transcription initiation factor TFIID subunit 5 isoform X2 n=1 Tax=Pygocentrus nattereri TaxID=42514 RepID=UPI001891B15B|nr:transcription initiation factor TFIID subunit 5 isoform X2 [Pygocentrus nattereri]
MAAVQDGGSEPEGEKEPQPELPSDGSSAPAATPASKPEEQQQQQQQTLLAVLQFLKRNKLIESVDALRREAGLADEPDEAPGSEAGGGVGGAAAGSADSADASALLSRVAGAAQSGAASAPAKGGEDQPDVSVVLSAYSQQGDPSLYQVYYSGLKKFIESVLDCHRAELSQLFYPLFVHMYLELVYNNHESEAKAFFEKFSGDQECYYQDDLRVLSGLTKKEHMKGNETLLDFRTSKFVLRISRDSYQLLKRHLQERQNNQIWNIIQEHLYIDIFDGMPRSKSQIDSMSGSLAGEARREANKAKVFYGLLKEPEIEVPLDDEDEEAENEEGKPKKKKPKKDSMGSKSKKQDPNAPQQNRIPLPELKDSDKLDKIMYMKEATKRIRLGPETLPSICFYTFLNVYQGLTAVDFTDDSSLIAGGFADSTVRVWSVTPKKLRKVKSAADLSLIDKESDDVLERIMDEKTASESKILYGHSGPVYGVSFSPDSLWATDHYQPLRMFAGHLGDITCTRFHPNSNYVATGSADRTIRLWDVLNGHCVRVFTGHKGPIHSLAFSPNGKYLASGSTDGRVLLWDLGHGLMIGELKGHTDTVYALKFSRDGEILASGSMDNTVRLWDAFKAFDDVETDDFTAATGHIHLPDNSQELLLGTYLTKATPVIHLHFTRRNLLLAAGSYNSQ